MPESAAQPVLRVVVIYSPAARDVREWNVAVPQGSTVSDAIDASSLRAEFGDVDLSGLAVSVWGQQSTPQQPLREGDRIEISRPLKVDPKVARRERFRRQGVGAAGLFARKK